MIFAQLTLGVFGHGRVVVCREDGGQSHIELIHDDDSAIGSDDHCARSSTKSATLQSGICSGTPCVDELLSFTFLAPARRNTSLESGNHWIPGDLPTAIALAIEPWTVCPPLDSTCADREHLDTGNLCAIRTLVLIL